MDELVCEFCVKQKLSGLKSNWVPVRYHQESNRPTLSRTSSLGSIWLRRHYWKLLIMLLALFQTAEAYITVSTNGICKHIGPHPLRLSPHTATSLLLEASNHTQQSCRLEVSAPGTEHSISLLFTRRKRKLETPGVVDKNRNCSLRISFPFLQPEDEVQMTLDLCSEEAFKTFEHNTELLPPQVTLEWIPNGSSTDDILASEIVVAAVGRGREICSQPGQFPCGSTRYPIYCISKELVCDGKRNCPFQGNDEEKEFCSSGGSYEKAGPGKPITDNSNMNDWEYLASEFLKKLSSNKDNGNLRKSDMTSTTERSAVDWPLEETNSDRSNSESLPDVLSHYGPWGYLMLGMLICGTVLMFCGLWECCCRRPKAPSSSGTGPTLLIINQGAQQNELETPQTPGPPRYEELDQPPSYTTLFPSSKPPDIDANQTNTLPITIPIVESLSSLLTNSTSSQTTSSTNHSTETRGHSVGSSRTTGDVFTIDLHHSSYPEIQRDGRDQTDSGLK